MPRYKVRDAEPPYDPIGYVPGPAPAVLTQSGFRHRFRLSRFKNDHPQHFSTPSGEQVELLLGAYEHERHCTCGECRTGNRPPREMCFMAVNAGNTERYSLVDEVHPRRGVALSPTEYIRRIIGFHPLAVRRVECVSVFGRSPK